MSNLSKAAEDLKTIANRFKAVLEVADSLEKIGSLEQATKDAEIAKEKAYKENEETQAVIQAGKEDLAKMESELLEAKAKIKSAEEEATLKSYAILEKAQLEAKSIVDKSCEEKLLIEEKILESKKDLFLLDAKVKAKDEELVALQSQIEDIKKKLSLFVAG